MTSAAFRLSALCAALLVAAPAAAAPWPFGSSRSERVQPAQSNPGEMALRLGQLENLVRQLNGRVEQLEHQNRQLSEALQRFQGDVDFRLQGQSGGGQSGGAQRPAAQPQQRPAAPQGNSSSGRGAPPQMLGQIPGGGIAAPADGRGGPGAPMVIGPGGAGGIAAPPSDDPEDQFALAEGFLQRRDWEPAQISFRQFVDANPEHRRVPDALYGLGESLFQAGQYQDAIEPFLTVVTKHGDTDRGPESLLRLGQALAQIGERDNACATFGEIDRKYPRAQRAKSQADIEERRLGC